MRIGIYIGVSYMSTCACAVKENIDTHPKGDGAGGGVNTHSQGDVSFKTPYIIVGNALVCCVFHLC